ncbi:MAG: enolase C-terminal domain-like protein [Candidatus Zixiibacteriota bacterium]
MHLDSLKISIPLKKAFTVSKGSATVKTNILSVMNNRYNGEASGSVHAGPSVAEIETDLKSGLQKLSKFKRITLDTLEEVQSWNLNAPVRSAISAMLLHYLSGESTRYPWEILQLATPAGIKSSFTIAIASPEAMLEDIKTCDYSIVKIKMGNDDDIALLEGLKQIRNKEIRVDSNGGWDPAKAEEMILHLSRQGVRIIEQPTDFKHIKDWKHLKGKLENVELIVDEGVNVLKDYREIAEHVDGVNIKMEKCGGILEGMKIARAARDEKKKIMLGCMVESSVGISQSVYMSSLADYFDLDGPQLLESDIAEGIRYDKESIEVDREIIGGPKLKRDVIEKYIQK